MSERLTEYEEYLADKEEYERHLAQGYPRNIARERFFKLAEYEYLEEQGLLLRLPCKTNTTVYIIPTQENSLKGIAEMESLGYSLGEPCDVANLFSKNRFDKNVPKMYQPTITDFGKTVFLTREEAEEKLKGMEGGGNEN